MISKHLQFSRFFCESILSVIPAVKSNSPSHLSDFALAMGPQEQ